ncbi:MAG TPA: ParM/StbA family protein [Herpetosiphonaceae bacterium]
MATHPGTPVLITADIGNVNTKFRSGAGWTLIPSLVRLPGNTGYSFTDTSAPRPLTYRDGPAQIAPVSYVVGHDAQRVGVNDLSFVGSAALRVRSDAYLLLHLYAIVASLPSGVTTATVMFAGGLPVADDGNETVKTVLKERLRGTHRLRWGDTEYTITIDKLLLIPQPIGAIATLLYTSDGRVQASGTMLRQRFALDIGGGTTDYTGRRGLDLIPGTEGGVALGAMTAAEIALRRVQARHPRLRNLDATQVLHAMQRAEPIVFLAGDPIAVKDEIQEGVETTAAEIVRHVSRCWQAHLEQGEVLLFGGGGALLAGPISQQLGSITRVTLLPHPLYRVVDGIERIARSKLAA